MFFKRNNKLNDKLDILHFNTKEALSVQQFEPVPAIPSADQEKSPFEQAGLLRLKCKIKKPASVKYKNYRKQESPDLLVRT